MAFECLAEKKWVEAVNINDKIGAEFQFEVKIINTSQMTLFSPLFVEFETIDPNSVTVDNPDRGGNTIGAVFDYSDSLGGDGKLVPGEMTTFKLWVFNDPAVVNFEIFANVFAFLGGTSPIAKTTNEGPIKIYVNVNNESVEIITGTTDVEDPAPLEIPTEFALQQNYPNPFNPETTIRFELPQAEDVTINIYNLHGQLVRKLTVIMRQQSWTYAVSYYCSR